jgi:hypothetical protein
MVIASAYFFSRQAIITCPWQRMEGKFSAIRSQAISRQALCGSSRAESGVISEHNIGRLGYELQEPFVLRLFGLGNLVLLTHDESNPTVVLRAIPGAKALRDQIRQHVEECRDKKRVRVAELE